MEHEHMEHSELDRMRHSASHVMAQAVMEQVPGAKFAIGPAIEDGFYYDFDLPRPLTSDDLAQIEARIRQMIKANVPFVRREVSRAEAEQMFADQPYKLEIIRELPEGEVISIYTHDGFTDLCRGPHVASTGAINADGVKVLNIAGAYWRGDEKRPMLQRVYGTARLSKADLDAYLEKLAEIERRDHRKLGKQLDLYSLHELGGAGLAYWHPKGARIRTIVEDFWRDEHFRRGYDVLYTPHIGRADLWKISGHWDFYRDSMYSPMDIDGQDYLIKPMNCPFAVLIYKTSMRSYRDLPLRWGELGTVYRYERSGVLHGMLRVRGFTQDDAHIFCSPDQLEDEIVGVSQLAQFMLQTFGYKEYVIELSVRDPQNTAKYVGSDESWVKAEDALLRALQREGLSFTRMEGEAKFYGPAIDIKVKDALGRAWQGPTIQVDFNFPERFDLTYVGEDGQQHRPVMVHRTVLGSMERFIAGLVEHYAGAFPVWLAPVQAALVPIADRHNEYAHGVARKLKDAGYRVVVDDSSERMNNKIRKAQNEKIPYMLVIGDREMEAGAVAVRKRTGEDLKAKPLDEFLTMLAEDVRSKVIW
jgi:threonyl-tRNA synthetase